MESKQSKTRDNAEKPRRGWKRAGALFLCLALLFAFLGYMSYLLPPARLDYGAAWEMYRREPKNSVDVLFFGSSIAYCGVIPAQIWQETGRTAYLAAGPEQTLSLTYYTVREALKTQRPSVVFLEVTGVMFDRYENYGKVNLYLMPYFSLNRIRAALFAVKPEERFGLFFPLYDYHDRWEELTLHDLFSPRADAHTDIFAGATLMTETNPQTERGPREYAVTDEQFEENLGWLRRIEDLCRGEGITLVLWQSPSCAYIPEQYLAGIRASISDDTRFVDFNGAFSEIGLDTETDFYDALHLNLRGAEKFTHFLSAYIDALPDDGIRRARDEALWQARLDAVEELAR